MRNARERAYPMLNCGVQSIPPKMSLNEFLAAQRETDDGGSVAPGTQSEWLFLCDYKVYGNFLQLIEKRLLGDLRGGVIVELASGMYVIEAQVITYAEARHISRMRVCPQGIECSLGDKIDEVHVVEGGLAISDVDALARALDADPKGFRDWHKDLLIESYEVAGVAYWPRGNMEFPFVEGGFGEDYYPVYALMAGAKAAGVEVEYIPPGTPYPTRSKW